MLQQAFKEWAVICAALAAGKQALILRKGGIAEVGNEFQVEHNRFWLYPTYVHQQQQGIQPEAQSLLQQVEATRPPAGTVRLTHYAEVLGVYHVHNLPAALMLAGMHLWSEETVRARFAYRRPGLYVLPVRIYQAGPMHEFPETAAYAGCRSWVELEQPLPTDPATPVLPEAELQEILRRLDILLNPIALA